MNSEPGIVREAAKLRSFFLRERSLLLANRVVGRALIYLGLIIGIALFTGPLYWMIASGMKAEGDVFEYPPNFIPQEIHLENYPEAINQFPLISALRNTMFVIVMTEIGRLLTSSLAAYGFARVRFPHRDKIFILVLSTLMIPYHVTLIPQFLIFRDLGLLDSLHPLYIPNLFGGGAFFIFLLRQFFMTIPQDYDDAARIDGCGTFGIYWKIIMPQSLPALGAVAIFTFMWTWEDFLGPLIYVNSPEKHTVSLAFQQWERSPRFTTAQQGWNHIMAMGTVITLPPILMFFFAQRYFIQGVVISGVKG